MATQVSQKAFVDPIEEGISLGRRNLSQSTKPQMLTSLQLSGGPDWHAIARCTLEVNCACSSRGNTKSRKASMSCGSGILKAGTLIPLAAFRDARSSTQGIGAWLSSATLSVVNCDNPQSVHLVEFRQMTTNSSVTSAFSVTCSAGNIETNFQNSAC